MTDVASPAASRRRRRRLLVAIIIMLAGAAGSSWWYFEFARWQESTDNAYLKGNLISIAAEVPGQVMSLLHDTGDQVAAGEALATLNPGDAERALQEAQHILGFAVRDVLARRAAVTTAQAHLELRRTTGRLADEEYRRRRELRKRGTVSVEELEAAQTRAQETRAELAIAERELVEAELRAGAGGLEDHPMIQVAAARVREAYRHLKKQHIISPVDGRVARRYAQVGQVVNAGAPLFSVVESNNFWIEANFKENQLRHLRPGQPVEAIADLYGSAVKFQGQVTSLGAGTGAEFSILPPQNATGNWIKIVQRVPVRIDLAPTDITEHPLPLGSSITLTVDTHDRHGPALQATRPLGRVSANAIFEDLDAGAQVMIDDIIARYSTATSALDSSEP